MPQGKGRLLSLGVVAFPLSSFCVSFPNGAIEQMRKQFKKVTAEIANGLSFLSHCCLAGENDQEANLHIETFQLLLLGLLRVFRAWQSEELCFRLSLGEKSRFLRSHIIAGLHFTAGTSSY